MDRDFKKEAFEACPFWPFKPELHDPQCKTCMVIAHALEAAYKRGQASAFEEAAEMPLLITIGERSRKFNRGLDFGVDSYRAAIRGAAAALSGRAGEKS